MGAPGAHISGCEAYPDYWLGVVLMSFAARADCSSPKRELNGGSVILLLIRTSPMYTGRVISAPWWVWVVALLLFGLVAFLRWLGN